MKNLIPIGLIFLIGCSTQEPIHTNYKPQIALESIILSDVLTPITPAKYERSKCPYCKGTGKLRSGDGLFTQDCPYCEPDRSASKDELAEFKKLTEEQFKELRSMLGDIKAAMAPPKTASNEACQCSCPDCTGKEDCTCNCNCDTCNCTGRYPDLEVFIKNGQTHFKYNGKVFTWKNGKWFNCDSKGCTGINPGQSLAPKSDSFIHPSPRMRSGGCSSCGS